MDSILFLSFIKWENFTDPIVILDWSLHLMSFFIFVFLSISYSYSIVRFNVTFASFNKTAEMALRYLLGLALISFCFTFFGLIGWFNKGGFILTVALLMFITVLRNRDFLKYSFILIVEHIKYNKWYWIVAIAISLNTLLLPFRNDEMTYHLAYPQLWFMKAEIFMDSALRYPTYTFNYNVLALLGLVFDSTTIIHLLNWSVGVMGAFFIKGFLLQLTSNRFLSGLAFFAFLFTPIIQEFLNSFYIDIAYQVFLFCGTVFLVQLNHQTIQKNELWIAAAILLAFFVGIKVTGFLYIPLFILIIFYPFKNFTRIKWITTFIFLLLGSIWFIRSFYLTNDPIWPAVNLNVFGEDALWSKGDLDSMNALIKKTQNEWGWKIIYKLPIELLTSSTNGPIQGWPLLGYAILGIVLPCILIKEIIGKRSLFLLLIVMVCTIMLWLLTSIQIRYTYFTPFLLFFSIYGINKILLVFASGNKLKQKVVYALSLILVLGPLPNAYSYSKNFFSKRIHQDPVKGRYQAAYNTNKINSIYELNENNIINEGATIYTLGYLQYRYYFYKNGFLVKGDDFGLYRNKDFIKELHTNNAKSKFREYKVEYLLVDKSKYIKFISLMREQGFKEKYSNEYFIIGTFE